MSEPQTDLVHLTVDEAIEAVRRCSFTTDDDPPREIVHVFAGGFGADWDTESVVDGLRTSRDRAWADHIAAPSRCLLWLDDEGRMRVCDTVRPV